MRTTLDKLPKDIKIDLQSRGTRIILGGEKRKLVNDFKYVVECEGFIEIELPLVESQKIYEDKAGKEILDQMYIFKDKGDRDLCLRPEGTATCQLIAQKWKNEKDLMLWYETKCFRYEKPQEGRYREFTQFGVEILNPSKDYKTDLLNIAKELIGKVTKNYEVNDSVKRGLAYYVEDGFEISCPSLGAQKQVCGGGSYKEGIGFAIGIDRLLLAKDKV